MTTSNTMTTSLTELKGKPSPVANIKAKLDGMTPSLAAQLPRSIPVEKFKSVVMTAVQQNPELWTAEPMSLFMAAKKCAADGLLPDGREALLTTFKNKNGQMIAQYMPMKQGYLKRLRNSGELLSIAAHVVYERDEFDYELGDDERIRHKPYLDGDRGRPIAAYAVGKTKDGGIYRRVMSLADIEKRRAVSRAGNSERGPWTKWWDEMAEKTVIKALCGIMPSSTDLPTDESVDAPEQLPSVTQDFEQPDALPALPDPAQPERPRQTRRQADPKKAEAAPPPPPEPPQDDENPEPPQGDDDPADALFD